MEWLVDAHPFQSVHKLLRVASVKVLDDAGSSDIGRYSQNLGNSQFAVSASMPVVVFHDTAMHRLLSVAGVYDIVRSDFSVFQSYHDRGCLEGRTRFEHIADCIVAYFIIFTVSALRHIDDGFYFSGCNFHQYDYTHGGVQLFQLVYQCFFANILHTYIDGGDQVATVDRGDIDNVQVFVHHLLAVS